MVSNEVRSAAVNKPVGVVGLKFNVMKVFRILFFVRLVGPTVFRKVWNLEPSRGICPLPWNFAELEKCPMISTIVGDILP